MPYTVIEGFNTPQLAAESKITCNASNFAGAGLALRYDTLHYPFFVFGLNTMDINRPSIAGALSIL